MTLLKIYSKHREVWADTSLRLEKGSKVPLLHGHSSAARRVGEASARTSNLLVADKTTLDRTGERSRVKDQPGIPVRTLERTKVNTARAEQGSVVDRGTGRANAAGPQTRVNNKPTTGLDHAGKLSQATGGVGKAARRGRVRSLDGKLNGARTADEANSVDLRHRVGVEQIHNVTDDLVRTRSDIEAVPAVSVRK